MTSEKKLIIDEQLAHGLGEQLIDALAIYFKIPAEQIKVSNDETSPEHTIVNLTQIKRSAPKVKLRLQELERHLRTEVYFSSDSDITDIELRIEDAVIVDIAQKMMSK